MEPQTDPLAKAKQPEKGDIVRALAHLTASIGAAVEVLDELSKRLDSVLLDSQDPSLASVAKPEQSRSPLANDLQMLAGRIIAHRLLLQRLCDMIQL